MKKSLNTVFASTALIIFTACSSLQVTEESVSNQAVAGVMVSPKSQATQAVLANAVIYFEYDKFTLTSKSIQALKGVVTLMRKNPKIMLSLEGHADERGTREYNLAIGERRANAAKDYLLTYGISSDRISVISYGKERPVDSGSNPLSWSKNRRSVTVKAN